LAFGDFSDYVIAGFACFVGRSLDFQQTGLGLKLDNYFFMNF
jgi:hypothetical protein